MIKYALTREAKYKITICSFDRESSRDVINTTILIPIAVIPESCLD